LRHSPSVRLHPIANAGGSSGRSHREKRPLRSRESLSRALLLSFVRLSLTVGGRLTAPSKASSISDTEEPRSATHAGFLIAASGIACQVPAEKVRPTATIRVVVVIGELTTLAYPTFN
jgi:hypothetical protein